jgi:hypothetical protein
MSKVITWFILIWLVVLTGFTCYVIKAEREFLKFADFVLDDNLKNVVKSGGGQFYVVDMAKAAVEGYHNGVTFWSPVYVNAVDLEKLINWKQTNILMVKQYEEMDLRMQSMRPFVVESADRYMKLRMAAMEDRKLTPKEKKRLEDLTIRKREAAEARKK